jgi:hypothetical protein
MEAFLPYLRERERNAKRMETNVYSKKKPVLVETSQREKYMWKFCLTLSFATSDRLALHFLDAVSNKK